MATNPYINKVQYGGNTLIDLTADTVTADKILEGYTAHDASGASIIGSYVPASAPTPKLLTYNKVDFFKPPIDSEGNENNYIHVTTTWQKLLPASVTRWAVGIKLDGNDVKLGLDYENESNPTTITIASVSTSSYKGYIFVREVVVLSPVSFLISFMYPSNSSYYKFYGYTSYVRCVNIKEYDKTFIQSSNLNSTISTSSDAGTFLKILPNPSLRKIIVLRVYIKYTSSSSSDIAGMGAFYGESSYINYEYVNGCFITTLGTFKNIFDNSTGTSSNLYKQNYLLLGIYKEGILFYYRSSSSFVEFHTFASTQSNSISYTDNFKPIDNNARVFLGFIKNCCYVFADEGFSSSSGVINIFIYRYNNISNVNWYSVSYETGDNQITKSSTAVFIVGMQDDIIVLSDGARYQIIFNADNTFSLQELSSVEAVSELYAPMRAEGKSYLNVSADSDPYSNMYIEY